MPDRTTHLQASLLRACLPPQALNEATHTHVQEAVMKRFVAAEPRHGERWQRVAKDPANVHQKPEALLKRVVLDLDKDL